MEFSFKVCSSNPMDFYNRKYSSNYNKFEEKKSELRFNNNVCANVQVLFHSNGLGRGKIHTESYSKLVLLCTECFRNNHDLNA